MRKLEICGYLPYDVKMYDKRTAKIFPVVGIEMKNRLYHSSGSDNDWWCINDFKPILRPLSDLCRIGITINKWEYIETHNS
jgi:hypothetical protein